MARGNPGLQAGRGARSRATHGSRVPRLGGLGQRTLAQELPRHQAPCYTPLTMIPDQLPPPSDQLPPRRRKKEKHVAPAIRTHPTPYWTGAHTTHRLRYHLVWIPKYRRRVLEGTVAVRVRQLLEQAAEVNRWQLHELNVQSDHVHLLLQIHPKDRVAEVVQRLKGGSSRLLRQEFPELEEFLWGKSFWCDGYFAESVGQTEEGVIRRYIRQQRQVDQSR